MKTPASTSPPSCTPPGTFRAPRAIDRLEQVVVLALFAWLVARLLMSYATAGGPANLLLLPSEGLVVLFMLIRRPTTNLSRRPADWLLAFAATIAPLAVQPEPAGALLPGPVGAGLMLMGILVQLHAKLALGRSIGCVPAHRGLKFSGPYRFVRHPMYLGYLLADVGFALMNPTAWNLAVYLVCYAVQVPRLLAEERLLRQDGRYLEYAAAVRFRLLPGIF